MKPQKKPRPYQLRCVDAVLSQWVQHQSTLAVLATGAGKTFVAAELCRTERQRSFLFLAHREELVTQAAASIAEITGERVGIEMADQYADRATRIVVASVQTLARADRRERFGRDRFDRGIIDEAHHAPAKSYREQMDYWDRAKWLGITATPHRSDNLALGQVFESVAFEYDVSLAIADGYLCPVKQYAVQVEGLDFSNLKSVEGDLTDADLERILSEETVLQQMALPSLQIAGDLPGIVFCSGVAHANLMAAILNRYKPSSAKALHGETPKDERRHWVERYKAGQVQWLCNCGLFLEGFDAPRTAVVVMGRPTKSRSLYAQMLGRGTRTLPGLIDGIPGDCEAEQRREAIASSGKPYCMVLDFVGNAGRHKLVSSLDILGGKVGEPVREYARRTLAEEGSGAPVDEALDRAEVEYELELEEERRRKIKARAAEYQTQDVDPFSNSGGGGSSVGQVRVPPSAGQVNYLVYRAGWSRSKAESLSKSQASAIIGKHRKAGDA